MRLLMMSSLLLAMTACDDKENSQADSGATSVVDEDGDGFDVGTDCDDSDPLINPDAEEICDEIDNNCDGDIDSGLGLTIYADNDGDGFGLESTSATSCELPSGYAAQGNDCNDADPNIHPDADEICNGLDDNCDSENDNDAVDAKAYYVDSDGDDVGDSSTEVISCTQPTNYVEAGGDCDDTNDAIFPGNPEACDGIDNDCDAKTSDYGSVSFETRNGAVTDLTSIFESGSSTYPARYYIENAGELTFCGGAWKGALIINADVDIIGKGGSGDNILDAAEEFPSILIESGARSVSIEGVTFRRGKSNLAGMNGYRRSGGGLFCDNGANIALDDVIIKEAEAEAGGAMYISNCTVSMNNTVLTENNAVFGGAVAIDRGTITMTDSDIVDNSSNLYAGAMYLYSQNGEVNVTMTDSFLENNSANYYGAVYMYRYSYNINLTCNSTSSGSGGIIGNSDTYYGGMYLYMYNTATFTSSGCDFGESGSSRDNTPNDIYQYSSAGSAYFSFGDDESFSCRNNRSCQ
jgi:hypothetical protein